MIIRLIIFFIIFLFVSSKPIIATWIKHPQNPILPIYSNYSWDYYSISAPTVVYINNYFQMWYEGHNSSNWRIVYATSSNGVVWDKYNNYDAMKNV